KSMVAGVSWSDEALGDVEAIAEYIHRDSPAHARRIVDQIIALAESASSCPRAGRVVPELNDDNVRERFLYSFRFIYEIFDNRIHVLAVIHGRRLLESINGRMT